MKATGDESLANLAKVLHDFGSAPGNYLVRRGQPRELHAQLDTLASWALGRVPSTLQTRSTELQAAAVMFVQRACFAPDNTHYQVLGLAAKTLTPEALRARYRALIRLTHPDMGVLGLPSNAAGIVNRAHEVLRDPDQRRKYDDQLAQRSLEVIADQVTHLHQAPILRRIEIRHGWIDRWQSLVARYPRLVRFGLAVSGFGLVAIGGIFLWASSETQESRLLIVAAERDSPQSDKFDVAPLTPSGPEVHTKVGTESRPPAANMTVGSQPLTSTSSWRNLWRDVPEPATEFQASSLVSRQGVAAVPPIALAKPTIATEDSGFVPTPFAPLPKSVSPKIAVSSEQRLTNGAANQPQSAPLLESTTPPVAASTPPPSAAQQALRTSPTVLPAPIPPVEQATSRLSLESQTPSSSPPISAWSIDTVGAKHYLTNLISGLERPSNALRTNAYLVDMKVQGSLLLPALTVIRQYRDINVEQMTWTDSQRPGVMKVQGMVVLMLKGSTADENRRVNFHLSAEFWGTRNGTVLSSLNLKEGD